MLRVAAISLGAGLLAVALTFLATLFLNLELRLAELGMLLNTVLPPLVGMCAFIFSFRRMRGSLLKRSSTQL